jgi:hypothetical protein
MTIVRSLVAMYLAERVVTHFLDWAKSHKGEHADKGLAQRLAALVPQTNGVGPGFTLDDCRAAFSPNEDIDDWPALRAVTNQADPRSEKQASTFREAVRTLTEYRNITMHGRLEQHSEDILDTLFDVLAGIHEVAKSSLKVDALSQLPAEPFVGARFLLLDRDTLKTTIAAAAYPTRKLKYNGRVITFLPVSGTVSKLRGPGTYYVSATPQIAPDFEHFRLDVLADLKELKTTPWPGLGDGGKSWSNQINCTVGTAWMPSQDWVHAPLGTPFWRQVKARAKENTYLMIGPAKL